MTLLLLLHHKRLLLILRLSTSRLFLQHYQSLMSLALLMIIMRDRLPQLIYQLTLFLLLLVADNDVQINRPQDLLAIERVTLLKMSTHFSRTIMTITHESVHFACE